MASELEMDPQERAHIVERLASIGAWQWDIKREQVWWSDRLFHLAGLAPGHIDFQRYAALFHPDDLQPTLATIQAAVADGTSYELDHRIIMPDGSVRWWHCLGEVVKDEAGEPARLIGTVQDVTELRVAQGEARAKRRSDFLAAASATLASSLDYEETLHTVARLAVPSFADYCVVDLIDDAGKMSRLLTHHVDPAKVAFVLDLSERYPPDPTAPHGVHQVIRTRKPDFMYELPDELLERSARDAQHLQILRSLGLKSYAVVPMVARDRVLGAMTLVYAESNRRYNDEDVAMLEDLGLRAAVAIDNAQLVRAIEEHRARMEEQAVELEMQSVEMEVQTDELIAQRAQLEKTLASLEHANQTKASFLAVMSHELRTPLNAMIGYTELLLQGLPVQIPDAARPSLDRIGLSARHLLELIEEILLYARMEAGRETLNIESTNLSLLLDEVCAIMDPLAAREGLTFECRNEAGAVTLETDARKLRQIMLNLIGNAIKFTDAGRIGVLVTHAGDDVTVAVTDTGIGIAPEHLDRIFDSFWQVESARSRRASGTGLGLTVTKRLVEMLGGTIAVVSEPDVGTTFTVSIPRVAQPSVSEVIN